MDGIEAHSDSPDRRTRKREATREAIERAAWQLFEDRGFARTTIDDITERADVAARTFFRHFRSKEAVLFGDPRALEAHFRTALLNRPPDENPGTALREALIDLANSVVAPARDRHLLRHRILHESGDTNLEDRFGDLEVKSTMLREVIAERLGTGAGDTRAELLGGITVTIMDVAYREWIEAGAKDDLAGVVERTFDTLKGLLGHARTA